MISPFKKYKGKTIEEIAAFDPDYLEWIKENVKAEGKFAKQNQALLDEIDRCLEEPYPVDDNPFAHMPTQPPEDKPVPVKAAIPQAVTKDPYLAALKEMSSTLKNIAFLLADVLARKPIPPKPKQELVDPNDVIY